MSYTCADAQRDTNEWFGKEDTAARDRAQEHIHPNGGPNALCVTCHFFWLDTERRTNGLVFPDPSAEPSL